MIPRGRRIEQKTKFGAPGKAGKKLLESVHTNFSIRIDLRDQSKSRGQPVRTSGSGLPGKFEREFFRFEPPVRTILICLRFIDVFLYVLVYF